MINILLPLIFIYFIWLLIKPEKTILNTPLFGYSLDYYIFKEGKPNEKFRVAMYEKWSRWIPRSASFLPDSSVTSQRLAELFYWFYLSYFLVPWLLIFLYIANMQPFSKNTIYVIFIPQQGFTIHHGKSKPQMIGIQNE